MRISAVLAIALLTTLTATGVNAAEPRAPRQIYKEGFEIRHVEVLSVERAKNSIHESVTAEQVVVTFQHGSLIAVCTMSLTNWIDGRAESLDNATLCRVH